MTLKEKFHQWLNTEPFSSKERPTLREAQLEVIADDYAIEFAEWIRKETYYEYLTKEFIYKRNVYESEKELLEIFKKEKGL